MESLFTVRITTIANSRITRLPVITRFGPNASSSLPPIQPPNVPATARMMPKVPIRIVSQPNVPAA
ncbi:hypothetical protein ABIE93_008735 [Bradyrhizobium elkanii]